MRNDPLADIVKAMPTRGKKVTGPGYRLSKKSHDMIEEAIRARLSELGRKGGKARVKSQTAKQREESARKAAQARWKKAKDSKK